MPQINPYSQFGGLYGPPMPPSVTGNGLSGGGLVF
jgi:hypothetical protein